MSESFSGLWVDASGHRLVVRRLPGWGYLASYRPGRGFRPRRFLSCHLDRETLAVELGFVGLGPTLRLTYRPAECGAPEALVPEVECGLYDDWEDDFGVLWVFPLSVFVRAARR